MSPSAATATTSGFGYLSYDPPRASRKKKRNNANRVNQLSTSDSSAALPEDVSRAGAWKTSSAGGNLRSSLPDMTKLLGILEARQKTLIEQRRVWEDWQDEWERARRLLLGIGSSRSVAAAAADHNELDAALAGLSLRSDPFEPTPRRLCILCLGLGRVSDSREAQYQFVYLRMLVDHLNVQRDDVLVYDPVFQPSDVELVEREGWKLLEENELGAHLLDLSDSRHWIAFLPHCPRALYESFLAVNLEAIAPAEGAGGLRCILLANDLRDYRDALPDARLRRESPHVAAVASSLVCHPIAPLPSSHAASNAFSSLVWQHLPERIARPSAAAASHVLLETGELIAGEIGSPRFSEQA